MEVRTQCIHVLHDVYSKTGDKEKPGDTAASPGPEATSYSMPREAQYASSAFSKQASGARTVPAPT